MTLQEFQQKFDGQVETQNLDFKGAMAWDVKSFAKDILAMSNLRDGGFIIIGIKEQDGTFVKEGLSAEQAQSYKIDNMLDQMHTYTDPATEFFVTTITDIDAKLFIVIRVSTFRDVPIIARTQINNELKPNTIYYRNSNRRVESAPVYNANDLRDIIEDAAIKLIRKRSLFGYKLESGIAEALAEERKSIEDITQLTQIKSKGYWQLIFEPSQNQEIELLKNWETLVKKSQVVLGWYHPALPFSNTDKQYYLHGSNYWGAFTDFGHRKQMFFAFNSGQFVSYNALSEDWYADSPFFENLASIYPPGLFVSKFDSVIHFVTGYFVFLSRLIAAGMYKEGLTVRLKLYNIKDRHLMMSTGGALPFTEPKQIHSEKIELECNYSAVDIMENYIQIANRIILSVLDRFGYSPDPASVLAQQEGYLSEG